MDELNIGSNKFVDVTIPIVFEDRYFLIESDDTDKHCFTVFTVRDNETIIEIKRNEPQENPISKVKKNAAGIITVSDPDTGEFLYKLRPGSDSSSIFGTIGGEEQEMKVKDHEIAIGTNKFQRNMISGFPVGILVSKDGSIAMGAQLPDSL
jgi:hypothetical protein